MLKFVSQQDASCSYFSGIVSKRVSFHARLDRDLGVSTDQTIVFPMVTNNQGQGCNASSGRFRAPLSGIYGFIASSEVLSVNAGVRIALRTTSQILDYVSMSGFHGEGAADDHSTGTVHGTAHVQAGEEAWIYCYENVCTMWAPATSFSGFLISADP
jgi:hypothetical protein